MTRSRFLIVLLVIAMLVVAGCGTEATPEPTPVPPTNTPVPPTNTPVPPTATPVPPTPTPVPPTPTPVPPTPTPEPEMADAFEAVREAAEGYLASGKGPTITAEALFENLNDGDPDNDPFILSVRSPEHYALGHIPGAVNIPWKQLAKPENLAKLPTDRPIVTYCYTGHTGQIAATALSLLGYDATNLKYGMMGWTQDDEVLATARYDPATAPDYPVETEANEATETYEFPELAIETDVPDDLVRAAIDAYLSSDKGPTISAEALFENLNDGDPENDPFILSVRSPEHYALGHIPGAVNIPWKEIANPENLAKLPPDRPIVVYCYTGHTGQLSTTILATLGYDATNLRFGMMGWTLDDEVLATARYDPATSPDYPLETGAAATSMAGAEGNAVMADAVAYFGEGVKTISAEALYENLNDGDTDNDPYIISVRAPEDYAAGHIAGAVNIGLKELFDPAVLATLPADKQIVVTCYTGQTAAQAVAALNMAGYDATSLSFGMSSWTQDPAVYVRRFDPEKTPKDYATVTEAFEWSDETYTMPETLGATSAEAAFAYLAPNGPKLVAPDAVFENLNDGDETNDPFIISVRSEEDYAKGHLPGALWASPKELFTPEMLAKLPTDRQIVVYCYTGQTAGQVVGALNMLGYDAASMTYGMSGWTQDPDVYVKRFDPEKTPKDYPTESGS